VYILFETRIYILALEMASPGNQHCANCIGTLMGVRTWGQMGSADPPPLEKWMKN